jgi:hypothetical protein
VAPFTDKEWKSVLLILAEVIGPDAQRYEQDQRARLTAAIPYLAGSEDPDRFAVSNLLTFHAATKVPSLFDHRDTDDVDVFRRLAAFHVGNHSDPRVVDYGLTLLALINLSEHERNAEADRETGKYNPLNENKWDVGALRKELEADLAKSQWVQTQFEPVVR